MRPRHLAPLALLLTAPGWAVAGLAGVYCCWVCTLTPADEFRLPHYLAILSAGGVGFAGVGLVCLGRWVRGEPA